MLSLKNKIISESLKLMSLNGYSRTSMEEILIKSGASKGGFYNHFDSKEDLLRAVSLEGRRIWRERNLEGLEDIPTNLGKLRKFLKNYGNRYLKDKVKLPGGCIFVALTLDRSQLTPELARGMKKGFHALRSMIQRLLIAARDGGELREGVSPREATDLIYGGMIGGALIYSMEREEELLDCTIGALIEYVEKLSRRNEGE
jgi:AcrR family transcriptional regulator